MIPKPAPMVMLMMLPPSSERPLSGSGVGETRGIRHHGSPSSVVVVVGTGVGSGLPTNQDGVEVSHGGSEVRTGPSMMRSGSSQAALMGRSTIVNWTKTHCEMGQ